MFALIHQLFKACGLQKLHDMVGKHLTWGNQASNYQLGYGPHWNQHRTPSTSSSGADMAEARMHGTSNIHATTTLGRAASF